MRSIFAPEPFLRGDLGPMVAASIADKHAGSYSQAYVICAVMLIVGAILALITRPPKVGAGETSL